jgi:hypothetical protein
MSRAARPAEQAWPAASVSPTKQPWSSVAGPSGTIPADPAFTGLENGVADRGAKSRARRHDRAASGWNTR